LWAFGFNYWKGGNPAKFIKKREIKGWKIKRLL
jgi:hypothetical protein